MPIHPTLFDWRSQTHATGKNILSAKQRPPPNHLTPRDLGQTMRLISSEVGQARAGAATI
jgi:hypothetical protein